MKRSKAKYMNSPVPVPSVGGNAAGQEALEQRSRDHATGALMRASGHTHLALLGCHRYRLSRNALLLLCIPIIIETANNTKQL